MDLRDCLDLIPDLLDEIDRVQRRHAAEVLRALIERGASEKVAAQSLADSGRFERDDILSAVEVVLEVSTEEAAQLLMQGRFTGLQRNEHRA